MEIENKVAKSGIITIDLEAFHVGGEKKSIDIKDYLYMGLILREKDFREFIKTHDWEQYRNCIVSVFNSSDAIVPLWAYMLVASSLNGVAGYIGYGTPQEVEEKFIIDHMLASINPLDYVDSRVVVKGCGKMSLSPSAYLTITNLLQPHVKSLMFGEPCSTVPVYKKK
jgi:hypothetical protein